MRFSLLLFPAAIVAAASPASARVYLSVEQAQSLLFPEARFSKQFVTLSPRQMSTLLWRVTSADGSGGWFIVDQVEGKGDVISYAIALSDEGVVQGIEIMECVRDYDTVRMPQWRAQFTGRKPGDPVNVQTISGSTLSSRHIAEGVQRILATFPTLRSDPS